MIRDITIGQYYPVDSVIHRLDPRVKLAGTMIFIISLFLFNNYLSYAVVAIFLASVIALSRVPLSYILKGLRTIFFLLVITLAFNLFLTPGKEIFRIWKLSVTDEGVKTALFMGTRLLFLIVGSSLMTLTTTPNQLTEGMEKGLGPLKKIGVPVHEVAMMMSIALRFIPILLEETDKIIKAQSARGADFESGNFITRAKAMVPILVPLFVSAFRRANDLAMAMEARCYHGGEGRTKMRPLKYEKRDRISYVIFIIYLILLISVNYIANQFISF